MAFDDTILHDVGGVKKLTFFDEGEMFYAVAKCGIGNIDIIVKPNIPFESGVVAIGKVNGLSLLRRHTTRRLFRTWFCRICADCIC